MPTTIKCHVVKIVITWSINPDENNNIAGLDPEGLFTGGGGGGGKGGTSSQRLEPSGASSEWGESMRGGLKPPLIRGGTGDLPRNFLKICVSENAFRAILNPIFPYSITSILSKVRHSNTLFLTIILHLGKFKKNVTKV